MQSQSRELIKNSFMASSYRFTLWLNQQNKLLSSIENRCEMGFCVTCLSTSWSLTESRCFIGIQLERLVQYNPKLITHNSRHKYYRHAHGLPSKEHGHLCITWSFSRISRWKIWSGHSRNGMCLLDDFWNLGWVDLVMSLAQFFHWAFQSFFTCPTWASSQRGDHSVVDMLTC